VTNRALLDLRVLFLRNIICVAGNAVCGAGCFVVKGYVRPIAGIMTGGALQIVVPCRGVAAVAGNTIRSAIGFMVETGA
jgi:hypothetical protein